MTILADISLRSRHLVGPFLGGCAILYFAYHTVQGERGLLAWWHLNKEVEKAEMILAELQSERQTLEHRVFLLRPDSLDPDMLEERSRAMLNMGRDGEVVLFFPQIR